MATATDRDLDPEQALDARSEGEHAAPRVPWWRQPLRWFFHLVLAVPLAVLLWSASLTAGLFLESLVALLALGVLGIIWVVRAVLVLAITPRAARFGRWLAVAPIAVALVLGLVLTDAPLEARWAQSRPAFEEVVNVDDPDGLGGTADQEWVEVPGFPRRVGTYDISSATRHGDEVAFVEAHGGFIDSTGFIYLPDGPNASNRQSPFGQLLDIHSLGGGWYTFTLHN